jgi:hypothetical protein
MTRRSLAAMSAVEGLGFAGVPEGAGPVVSRVVVGGGVSAGWQARWNRTGPKTCRASSIATSMPHLPRTARSLARRWRRRWW